MRVLHVAVNEGGALNASMHVSVNEARALVANMHVPVNGGVFSCEYARISEWRNICWRVSALKNKMSVASCNSK